MALEADSPLSPFVVALTGLGSCSGFFGLLPVTGFAFGFLTARIPAIEKGIGIARDSSLNDGSVAFSSSFTQGHNVKMRVSKTQEIPSDGENA